MPEEVTLNVKLNVDKTDLERQIKSAVGGGGRGGLLSGLGTGGGDKGGGLLGGLGGKLGFIGIALNQISELTGKVVGILKEASPNFAATVGILKQSMMLFFKPFGDFLGNLLRPLAIKFLKFMVAWEKALGGGPKERGEGDRTWGTARLETTGEKTIKEELDLTKTSIPQMIEDELFWDWDWSGLLNWLKGLLPDWKWSWSGLKNWFKDLLPDWDWSWQGLKNWFYDLLPNWTWSWDGLKDWLKGLLPDLSIGGLIKNYFSPAEDFIAQNGQITQFSPDDTIVGVKDTSKISGNNITVQVDSILTGDLVEQITERIRREVMLT